MSQNVDDAFIRQRRNLVVTSTFIAMYSIAELKINKLNFIFASGDINNPSSLHWFVFLICLYFLYRYHAITPRRLWQTFSQNIKTAFFRYLLDVGATYVRVEYQEIQNKSCSVEKNADLSDEKHLNEIEKKFLGKDVLIVNNIFRKDNDKNMDIINTRVIREAKGPEFLVAASANGKSDSEIYSIRLGDVVVVKIFLFSLWDNVVKNTFFGEYIFPYLVWVVSVVLFIQRTLTLA